MENIRRELEFLYKELEKLWAQKQEIIKLRGYNKDELDDIYNSLDYTDELIVIDDDIYVIKRAISELEWELYNIKRGEC